jgi:5-formyltetrahydrofolate cyclo-ligase
MSENIALDTSATCLSAPKSKSAIRKEMRRRRKQLSFFQQQHAARKLSVSLKKQKALKKAINIGLYFPCDGEISPLHYMQQHPKQRFFLPVIMNRATKKMAFSQFRSTKQLQKNYLNIFEPRKHTSKIFAQHLDVLLIPLTAFDKEGHRIGMGGGFYDRLLSHRCLKFRAPQCIGLAHACQQVGHIETDQWDISMPAIVTDQQRYLK